MHGTKLHNSTFAAWQSQHKHTVNQSKCMMQKHSKVSKAEKLNALQQNNRHMEIMNHVAISKQLYTKHNT